MKNLTRIPPNLKGKTVSINGVQILEHIWKRVISYVHDFESNHNIDFDLDDEYIIYEIINQLEILATEGSIDPLLQTFFEQFSDKEIHLIISYGQQHEWLNLT